uniref:DUF5727 domain-containing protein n=1 Tax=Schistocephalus solidus TaxID=70667 RepID=A0A0V0J4H2_SCHSO
MGFVKVFKFQFVYSCTQFCSLFILEAYKSHYIFKELELRNGKTELWFNGIFHKRDRNNNTYQWASGSGNYLSVSVDWTRTGLAPEDVVCFRMFKHSSFLVIAASNATFRISKYINSGHFIS